MALNIYLQGFLAQNYSVSNFGFWPFTVYLKKDINKFQFPTVTFLFKIRIV